MNEPEDFIKDNHVYNLDAKDFIHALYEDYGDESIDMFLCDFPYTFKGINRVTANKWDLPIDDKEFFDLALKMLTPDGCIALTASQPFTSYLVMNHINNFKYEWIWEKDNGSNFVSVKHQPFKVHESILIFGKAPITYNKSGKYMKYNPQFTKGKPYKIKRKGMTDNLATSNGYERTDGEYDGKRYPRSVQKFNVEKGLHPTQKPTKLFEYMIKTYTDIGGRVVDICCGSGTTAAAAAAQNRIYIVNDKNLKYTDITLARLMQ
ncbi:site-specific DNA-methyltransferase [Clostridium sp. FS41]|uniref:site-specific DNA-methyltransferase n=1 Tax=Clostridium sp. FS41 TaxID=1609975 RepID=UPI00061F6C52|nr:site-specific DNA-methyltransferase [Clostridium sp. FS41]KJJ75858.1 DNA adenine methyltransferase YhdJ [Clostridium sp. FS41]